MNREILFRVWDINGNPPQMYYDPFIADGHGPMKISQIMQVLTQEGWIWMQYIGLKDRNRSKIYEGDIVRRELLNKYYKITKWNEKKACFDPFADDFYWEDYDSSFSNRGWSSENIEVIGNIYENPELIELCKDL